MSCERDTSGCFFPEYRPMLSNQKGFHVPRQRQLINREVHRRLALNPNSRNAIVQNSMPL
jgi:hypothetical protein